MDFKLKMKNDKLFLSINDRGEDRKTVLSVQFTGKEIPATTFAVIRFRGSNTDDNVHLHKQKLREYLSENKVEPLSSPIYAFYNPPWTLPLMRRNEVMIEVELSQFQENN